MIEENKALKELLDMGAITQEEFDFKKRQILDENRQVSQAAINDGFAECALPASRTERGESKTSVALILGIVGIVTAWFFALVGHIVSITGIVLGTMEYKRTKKIAGLVLSIVGEACAIISSIIGAVLVGG